MSLVFSKSKLLASRQCPKRLWLEVHRPDLRETSVATEASFRVGHNVGEVARRIYDPNGSGALVDVQAEGFGPALIRSIELLLASTPIFEAGFSAEGALAFADVMLPVDNGAGRSWRMVEVKSSTSVKDHHRDDIAIQAFVALAAGVPLKSIAVANIDSDWIYPGDDDYRGLLIENDLTTEAFERGDEVRGWIAEAQAVARQETEPRICTGAHCSKPYSCGFFSYCQSQEPQPQYPVGWLPRLQTKAVKDFIETKAISDLRDVPDQHLNNLQRRVKSHTISGKTFFDDVGAAAELAQYELPAYFLDFETIQFAVPIWKGTGPYKQIPFQFSVHRMSRTGNVDHKEFLDLSGQDPSRPFAEALLAACHQAGPIYVYNAGFETARIRELSERFTDLNGILLALTERVVDLLPIARRHFYDPSQEGSWSIKSVLPAIAPDLRYEDLDGVQDGNMAMNAYLEAIHPETTIARKEEIRRQLLEYCGLDTFGLVRIWQRFAGKLESQN